MKVRTSLNSIFADIQRIKETQIKASEIDITQEDEDSGNKSAFTLDCIVVEQLINYDYFSIGGNR